MIYQRKQYYLGGIDFDSQKDLLKCIRAIIKENPKFIDLREDLYEFMLDLLKLHPNAKQKIGCGVKSFRIDDDHFQVIRIDGSTTDFSFHRCVSGGLSKLRMFKVAAREAVQQQIDEFRSQFNWIDLIGKHVDHKNPSFNQIVEDFIKERKIDLELVEISGMGDEETTQFFSDIWLRRDFADYHKDHAILQLLDAKENMKKGLKIL